ncbi:MAG: ABC transporter permease, partial [Proteiniphilum sp.]|nr:ABC transporter permease [Proteiniphilum sp.]
MNRLGLVIQREYITRVRKKSFIILTLLMPLLMATLSLVPLWLSTLNDGSVKNVAVIDNTGIYAPLLKSTDAYQFQVIDGSEQQAPESRIGKDLFAVLQITGDLNENPRAISLTSDKQAPQELQSMIVRTVSEKVVQQKLDALSSSG